tara:strand:- start:73 stop:288 length:216 start_codon:yes stop_codon:yes gene_type:complete
MLPKFGISFAVVLVLSACGGGGSGGDDGGNGGDTAVPPVAEPMEPVNEQTVCALPDEEVAVQATKGIARLY